MSAVVLQADKPRIRLEDIPIATYIIMTDVSDEILEGSFVADNSVLQYLSEHKDASPEDLIVAAISEPFRSIYMTVIINRIGQEECVMDNGSMI